MRPSTARQPSTSRTGSVAGRGSGGWMVVICWRPSMCDSTGQHGRARAPAERPPPFAKQHLAARYGNGEGNAAVRAVPAHEHVAAGLKDAPRPIEAAKP